GYYGAGSSAVPRSSPTRRSSDPCSGSYASGTVVTLTATPGVASTFSGWSGGACTGTGTCTVSMSAATMVTATFTPQTAQTFALTVGKAGTGSAAVTSSPAGISCG